MIYSILNIIFLNLTLYGVLKKNSCLNIFSCIIYCLQIFQYIGLIIIQLTFIILYIQKSEILQDEEKPLFYYMNLYYFIIPYQYKITFWTLPIIVLSSLTTFWAIAIFKTILHHKIVKYIKYEEKRQNMTQYTNRNNVHIPMTSYNQSYSHEDYPQIYPSENVPS